CPNKCRKDHFKRHALYKHVKDECPLTEIDCPLHYAGCEVRLPRKDMPEHMTDTVTHLTLLATVTQSLLKENQGVRQTTEDLLKENQEQKQTTEDLKKENQELQREVKELRAQKLGLPVEYRITKGKRKVYLPSFFSHSHGYKMSIFVYPDGIGNGKGTHVSLFACLMRGEYDDHLKWPFRGKITVQIVNQAGDHSHIEKIIPYTDKTPSTGAGRVTDKERGVEWGFHQFLALTDLEYNAENDTQYLRDDIIIVRV
ncbi:TNF receptor-associated factor 4, partial [Geodia barretti]